MGCKSQINCSVTMQNFNLDEMYEKRYSLQQISKVFKQFDKIWRTLDQKHATLFEEIHDYLEENYYNCYVCGDYFEDHTFTDPDNSYQECYSCFTEIF